MPAPRKCECGECKRCKHREYMNQWYRSKTLEERRAWVARRDQDRVRENDRARWQRDKQKRRPLLRAYVERYPEKDKARAAVARAIRNGSLVRQPCEVCGVDTGRIHAHHDDYSKPLSVRWLCQFHHTEVHKPTLPRKTEDQIVK